MGDADSFAIEVVYARPQRQHVISLRVPPGTRIEAAIRLSGILADFPEIELHHAKVGIFGRRADLAAVVTPGDRVEIYRPLVADPKTVRRQRARPART